MIVAVSLGALAVALASQYWGDLQPCVLCMYQRYAFLGAIAFGLLGLIAGPRTRARRAAVVLAGLAFLTGAAMDLVAAARSEVVALAHVRTLARMLPIRTVWIGPFSAMFVSPVVLVSCSFFQALLLMNDETKTEKRSVVSRVKDHPAALLPRE